MPRSRSRLTGQRCVVLGAGGFIGSNLCRRLQAEGADVIGFGRMPRDGRMRYVDQWVEGEFMDGTRLAQALDGASHVFHLLGGSNPAASNRDPARELERAVTDNLNLVQTIFSCTGLSGGTKCRLIFVSSGGTVYGPADQFPIAETAATNPISAYGLSKLMAEKLFDLYGLIGGLDHMVLRVANPYGPYQLPNRAQGFVATVLERAITGKPIEIWGDGSVVRDYLHIDDVVDALMLAMHHSGPSRLFNIGSGQGRSLIEVVQSIHEIIGRPIRIEYRAGRPADIPINILDSERAFTMLGWRPATDWESGIRETMRWIVDRA